MKDFSVYSKMYFLGIGGIGMSALARYFNQEGIIISGYDKTNTRLIKELIEEGADIHFVDKGEGIIQQIGSKDDVLIVYTPAISKDHKEFQFLQKAGYTFVKRAELLGWVTRENIGLAIAGTHGKTTTSCMLAHVMKSSSKGCNAFLGGISANYKTNFIADKSSRYAVVEADEFDRSFLHLRPFASILTSIDADHLDIYGDKSTIEKAFHDYVALIQEDGFLVRHHSIPINHKGKNITYGLEDCKADYRALDLRYESGYFIFDLLTPFGLWKDIELGLPGVHNVENAVAVIALAIELGFTEIELREGLRSFVGVDRRFEIIYRSNKQIYIDDYAHHPTAIYQLLKSVRLMFPQVPICGIFQPHLYSRTKDFLEEFAESLSALDQLLLLPIYPAREEPIEGVSSEVLLEKVDLQNKYLVNANQVVEFVKSWQGIILTIGAGDISEVVPVLKDALNE
jgi:UDP-N-acetylmuramate--alanine ligase